MSRILKCFVIGIGCCAFGMFVTQNAMAQTGVQNSLNSAGSTLRQTAEEIAALPPSYGNANARVGFAPTAAANNNSPQNHSTFFRQASAQTDVYPYPASSAPRTGLGSQSNYAFSRNNANAQLTNQISLGSNAQTGSLGSRINSNNQPPVYNLSPTAASINAPSRIANSRTPIEQQRASTLPQTRPTSFLAAGAGRSQPLVQPTRPASQPTTAFRQAVYRQPTLGLGNPQARLAQNCNCTPSYNPAAAAYQTPSLTTNGNQGLGAPPLNIQMPGQTGVVQPCCRPNYQIQPGVGTPQYGAQGASWWTPFVTGSGVYSPAVQFRNMPAGTYLGQGIIGQPTAYADGQPVRNLLRYISP